MIFLDTENPSDENIKENFEKISEVINSQDLIRGDFKVLTIDVTDTTGTVKVRHNLGKQPNNAWVSWVSNSSDIALKYDEFDENFVAFTSSQVCELKLILGRVTNG